MPNPYVQQTAQHIQKLLEGDGSGHDWWHIYRVWKNALLIYEKAPAGDLLTIELAALLHDIADHKFNDGNLEIGPEKAYTWLKEMGVAETLALKVREIVSMVSFKGAKVKDQMNSIEGKIVQDADRLDAIGAIGIARTFAYGGFAGQAMHDPAISYQLHDNFKAYSSQKTTTINHFYEKLLLLKERMHTEAARQIAEERHQFMEDFLNRFYDEWEGKR